jgi:hypothetical protein
MTESIESQIPRPSNQTLQEIANAEYEKVRDVRGPKTGLPFIKLSVRPDENQLLVTTTWGDGKVSDIG